VDCLKKTAKRFFDDAARDVRDSFETVQKLYTHVNKEPEKKLDAKLSEMKEVAAKYNVENYDAPYTRVNDAARVVGKELAHVPVYKLASKLAHPTAQLLCINRPLQDLQDTLYEGGAKLAVMCLVQRKGTSRPSTRNFTFECFASYPNGPKTA
jgi:hypothetical protein